MTSSTTKSITVTSIQSTVTGQRTVVDNKGQSHVEPIVVTAPDNAADTITILGGGSADTFTLAGGAAAAADITVAHTGGATVTIKRPAPQRGRRADRRRRAPTTTRSTRPRSAASRRR